jgi:hypothetical protein
MKRFNHYRFGQIEFEVIYPYQETGRERPARSRGRPHADYQVIRLDTRLVRKENGYR